MKRLFLLALIVIIFAIYLVSSLKPHHITAYKDKIEVTVVYHNERQILQLEPYTRIADLLDELALANDVDFQKINSQQVLAHKDVFNVPIIQEKRCVSINTADSTELSTLKGIGLKTAETIINHREEKGFFQVLEDLMHVKGIGHKKFDALVEDICL